VCVGSGPVFGVFCIGVLVWVCAFFLSNVCVLFFGWVFLPSSGVRVSFSFLVVWFSWAVPVGRVPFCPLSFSVPCLVLSWFLVLLCFCFLALLVLFWVSFFWLSFSSFALGRILLEAPSQINPFSSTYRLRGGA